MRVGGTAFQLALALSIALTSSSARDLSGKHPLPVETAFAGPAYCAAAHNIGRIAMTVRNNGTLGETYLEMDCFTGEPLLACNYPRGSNSLYLWGAGLWIGAVVGQDTLVSTGLDGWAMAGAEFHPDADPLTSMVYRSTISRDSFFHDGAVSEQDLIATFYDTCLTCLGIGQDQVDHRPHRPLGLKVVQRSYAWSHPMAEDFVLFDYSITNIGQQMLSEVYLGLIVDVDVDDIRDSYSGGALDDVTGFLETSPSAEDSGACPLEDTLRIAWAADNDGDLHQVTFDPLPHVAGMQMLQNLPGSGWLSYNWWISNGNTLLDYGPQARLTYRPLVSGGSGVPTGDREKYHYLSNHEIDYDQVRTATIPVNDPVWVPHSTLINQLALGADTKFLLSIGPFSIEPGAEVPFDFAYLIGENLHGDSTNFYNLPLLPDAYLANLDFSDLLTNAAAARRIYDNPGVDTDSDGYSGEYALCGEDTIWYRGDGVPDWRVGVAPPPPISWAEPLEEGLKISWNGFDSESATDPISREFDFEGYRVYLSTTGEPGSYVAVGSYDTEDFYRYYWDSRYSDWRLAGEKLTVGAARCRYAPAGCADSSWHPLDYLRHSPYVWPSYPDSVFYFVPVMANASEFGLETPFVKRYPSALRPQYTRADDVPLDSVAVYLTESGRFKYYEYEFIMENLVAGQPYWVAVAAFDWGSPASVMSSMESDLESRALRVVPLPGQDCCRGRVGNVDCDDNDEVTLSDVVALIDFLFIHGNPPCCWREADINLSGTGESGPEDVTLGDIGMLIDCLYISGDPLPTCP